MQMIILKKFKSLNSSLFGYFYAKNGNSYIIILCIFTPWGLLFKNGYGNNTLNQNQPLFCSKDLWVFLKFRRIGQLGLNL